MSFFDQIGEELQEKRDNEQADVHSVHVGIGCYDYFVVAQTFNAVFDVECCLKEVKLLIFIHYPFGESEAVQRFTAQAENCLCVHIPAFGDGAACRVAFGDEDGRIFHQLIFGFVFHRSIVEVIAAVAQLAVVKANLFCPFACLFGYSGYGFAFLFRFLNFLQKNISSFAVSVEVVVQLFFYKIGNEFIDRNAVFVNISRSEFGFGLRFKNRLFDSDGYSGYYSVAYIGDFHVFVVKLLDGTRNRLTECALMRTALGGVLSVDE